ncbi:isochorismatase family protein [Brevibacillus sp. B_LB10_24]
MDVKWRERGIAELHFVGVASNICVMHSVYGAYERGYNIAVHEK